MFIGEYHYNIDDKGRLFIPTEFKKEISDQVIVNRGIENCLYIYTLPEWDKIVEKLSSLSFTKKSNREFSRMFLSGAYKKDIDSKGRINIEKVLIDYANLDKECVILGVGKRIEVWAKEEWVKYYESRKSILDEISEEIELDI